MQEMTVVRPCPANLSFHGHTGHTDILYLQQNMSEAHGTLFHGSCIDTQVDSFEVGRWDSSKHEK